MNLIQAAEALDAYMAADVATFLWGAPGIGKSDLIRQRTALRNRPLIDVRAILLDPIDLRGLPMVADGRVKWAPPAFLPDASRDGPEGTLFLDELNAAPASTQAACFQLVLDRRLGEYTVPPGWRIVAAGNRQSDRAAANRMPTALANRFAHIDVDPDPTAWTAWAVRANVAPVVVAFVRFRPERLHDMTPSAKGELRAFPSPRAWAQVSKIVDAPDHIRPALVAGLVGEVASAEFEGFFRIWKTVRIADIIANPTGVDVPCDPGVIWAVVGALARKADRANFDSILTYARRLSPEFGVLLVTDAVGRDASLKTTAAFTAWAVANSDVLI